MFGEIRGNSIQAHNCEIGQRLGTSQQVSLSKLFLKQRPEREKCKY